MSPGRRPVELVLPELDVPAAGVRLRPWRADDVDALVAAWSVPDIAAETGVPSTPDPNTARGWISGLPTRAAAGLGVDLVVERDGAVAGEIGLARLTLRPEGGTASRVEWEVGWWLLPDGRGRGIATAAAARLAEWALEVPGIDRVVARIRVGHAASEAVATRLGFRRVGPAGSGRDLWVGPTAG